MVNSQKYDTKWVEKVKLVVKKTEKGKDKDGKETGVDISSIGKLIEERKPIAEEVDILEQEIQSGKANDKTVISLYRGYGHLEDELEGLGLKDNAKKTAAQTKSTAFRTGAYGWTVAINAQYSKNLDGTTATTATSNYKDNLYSITVKGTSFKITEEEMISLMARICQGIESSDKPAFKTAFETWYGNASHTGAMETAMDALKAEGKTIKDNEATKKDKTHRLYDFGYTYTETSTNNPISTVDVPTIIEHFRKWVEEVRGKKNVGGVQKSLGEILTKDNTHSETIDIHGYSVDGSGHVVCNTDDIWDTNILKDDFGIITDSSQNLYKNSKDKVVDFKVNGGLKGWIELAEAIFDTTNGNVNKLYHSFTKSNTDATPSKQHDLFHDIRGELNMADWHANHYSLEDMTNDNALKKGRYCLYELDAKRNLETQEVALSNQEINKRKVELVGKKATLTAKETEIQTLITEELNNIRTELKKVGIESGKTFAIDFPNGGTDNRKSITDLIAIKEQLENVRFLEKDDIEVASSVDEENTAYTLIKTLWDDYTKSKVNLWGSLEGTTNADKCKKIKGTDTDDAKLQLYLTDFEKWEKLIKFDDNQKQIIKDIKIFMGKQEDPNDTLQIYQDKLKALDALLDNTVITQAVIDDWKTQNKFKTSDTVVAEIKKVITKDGKLDEDFKKVMVKEDADITDLANLFKKKKAKDIITMIRRWEYDKETDTNEKAKTVKIIKMNMDKKVADADPTDEEITTGLYKLAVGEYKQKSEDEIKTWETGKTNSDDTQKGEAWFWPWHGGIKNWVAWGGTSLTVIGIACLFIFWNGIKDWWNNDGSKKEEAEEDKEDI